MFCLLSNFYCLAPCCEFLACYLGVGSIGLLPSFADAAWAVLCLFVVLDAGETLALVSLLFVLFNLAF